MSLTDLFLLLLGIVVIITTVQTSKDYCNPRWCSSNNLLHTACENNGRFSSVFCPPDIHFVKLKPSEKQFILDSHNQYRMMVALGLQESYNATGDKFPSARKMMRLVWSEEQAFMASLHLRTCLSHDPCHNTDRNRTSERLLLSGQNIFNFATDGERYTIPRYIELGLFYWFAEFYMTPVNVLKALYPPEGAMIGHFTQMIHDKVYDVGCALVQWTEDDGQRKCTRMTCNYAKAHYLHQSVYAFGKPCEDCLVCDEDEFYGLCLA